ncbi:hypothetical protein HMPREF1531_00979 [Propionibacterium sp. oral taxon 192 str. F0372]|uniref:beta-ketoacyl synthase N-terminal-like domain-containing protein n=1 Tax=Propionibacterium sp. oral taxon 192 TaxID=671222 RepID=UPI000353AEC2|nr:beta-ketoacyl synthase N-terminal-like domain-containing protein [Propionibacterium sp. oral taxon 192]EPH05550.1 hypothetical protein HMPREF1531_00979 [Propionibacterium sp. oral taxon 192 str. F0372]
MTIVIERAAVLSGPPSGEGSDWFDPRAHLGRRGTALLPRAVQLTAAAAAQLNVSGALACESHRRELWACTASFAEHMHDEMDAVVRAESAEALSPARAPYFSVNLLPARVAQDYKIHGRVVTITTPGTGLVDACASAALSLGSGRCDTALVVTTDVGGEVAEGSVALMLHPEGRGTHLTWARGFLPQAVTMRGFERLERLLPPLLAGPDVSLLTALEDAPRHLIEALPDELTEGRPLNAPNGRLLPQAIAVAEACQQRRTTTLFCCSRFGAWAALRLDPGAL